MASEGSTSSTNVLVRPARRPVEVLFELARRLGEALAPADVARLVVEEVVSAVGATHCVAYEIDPIEEDLVLVAHFGLAPGGELRLARLPRSTDLPLVRAINSGTPSFHGTYDELVSAYPHVRESAIPAAELRATAAMPFRVRGRVVGGLAFSFADERAFDEEARGFFLAVADLCAQALERARLFDSERRARAAAEQAAAQTRTLELVARRLSAALRAEEVANAVLVDAVDALGADTGGLWLANEAGTMLERIGQVGFAGGLEKGTRSFPVPGDAPVVVAYLGETPLWLEDKETYRQRFPESVARIESARGDVPLSAACVPLRVRDRVVGTLAFGFERTRAFGDADRTFLLLLAQHCAQALDRARLFESAERARREAEEALDRAHLADRRKDEFLAMLGHELRNPLAPIANAVQLMKMRGVGMDERARDVVERQVQHMSRLLDDLLDVSRITQGRIELKRKPTPLADVLEDAIEQTRPVLEAKGQEVRIDARGGALVVNGDPARLAQVVANLLSNASKYSESAVIHVATERAGTMARLVVKDDGIGIPADLLPHVFDAFVQAPQAIARSKGGLGLGLSIVKNLVTMHGGWVEARSEGEGRGSTFVVELPLAAEEASIPEAAAPIAPATNEAPLKVRVLVVDDNIDAAEMVALALETAGYDVRPVFDGAAALEEAERYRPEIVLLDIGLPVMSGYEVAARLAASPAKPRTLVAVTGYGQPADRARALESGFDRHFVKPLDLDALLTYLRSVTARE